MFLLSMSFIFSVGWCLYSIAIKDITMISFIFSWLAFAFALGGCLLYPTVVLVLWTLFLLVLAIGCLGIIHNGMEE